jgi:hypothetical protein
MVPSTQNGGSFLSKSVFASSWAVNPRAMSNGKNNTNLVVTSQKHVERKSVQRICVLLLLHIKIKSTMPLAMQHIDTDILANRVISVSWVRYEVSLIACILLGWK